MGLADFRDSLAEEIQEIMSSDFTVEITETDTVPGVDDPEITYPNLVTKIQKCKLIETCVPYIDIRRSTDLSFSHRRYTLAKLYSSFVRAMARSAAYYDGKVRGVIGDRLMVIFDNEDCFTKAVNTAILMNSVSQYLIEKNFSHDEIKCGIGIDYGKMLGSKVGIIKQGVENTANKSIVWLGRPANVASKLTDQANRTTFDLIPTVNQHLHYPSIDEYSWLEIDASEFLDSLEETDSPVLKHPNEYFIGFFQSRRTKSRSTLPILMTEAVFNGFKHANPDVQSLKEGWWRPQSVSIPEYSNKVYGGNVVFTAFKES